MPWWGAVVIALVGTAIGFAFDAGSGNRELGGVFAAMYLLGCVAAVLAVRQDGLFTAVVQPPLILFAAVPTTYYLFHHANIDGLKDILINCGYPLIERFLLMFTTSVIVLLIGMARWYFGSAARTPAEGTSARAKKAATVAAGAGVLAALKARVAALTTPRPADAEPRKHAIDRDTTAEPRRRPNPRRTAPSKSRHVRPPAPDGAEPVRPSRRRPTHARDLDDIADSPPPRRRVPREPGRRTPPPPESRREPRQPRPPYEPRDSYDRYDRPRPRPDRYPPLDEPYSRDSYDYGSAPRRRPPATGGSTHLPYSNVRYRGSSAEDGDTHRQYRRPPRRHAQD
ncbi:hypothetical protein AWB99_22140 [Mycolicibacterium confluentis]|uniref:Uncharacterized protein n=1 Tax=Mycolicibacterium confluentis TaxID=28047 RepID=A0A7I7XSE4_9MYCO|nr:hypothetical protein AWB99_22140 [Mycolicibacterium confluentis]BBZ32179.1 hypothetical protein MCNF_07840 [Mycolicibacterium confluentis]